MRRPLLRPLAVLAFAALLAAPAAARQAPPPLTDARVGVREAPPALLLYDAHTIDPADAAERLRRLARAAAPVRADSLPDGMPLHTRVLWGEGGLVRRVGLAPSTRAAEFRLRRTMLRWHQRAGLVTLAALTTQVVLGERLAGDPGRFYEDLQPIHKRLGYATFGVYLGTAGLSIFAPPARRYSTGVSSIRLHRWLAVVHLGGMLSMPYLGRRLADASSIESYDARLTAHRWTGRVTLGALSLAVLTTFLPY